MYSHSGVHTHHETKNHASKPHVSPIVCTTDGRSQWSSAEDPCQKKMSFELWALMKAEGSADDADAKHVRAECIKGVNGPLRLELLTPEV